MQKIKTADYGYVQLYGMHAFSQDLNVVRELL